MSKHPRRLLNRLLLSLASLLVLAALVVGTLCAWLYFSGHHEWKTTRADLLARGEKLDLTDFIPPPIPDADNFFADPLWAELSDLVPDRDKPWAKKPRLPTGQRALDLGIPQLTEVETAAIWGAFPSLKWPNPGNNRRSVIRAIWLERDRSPEGELRAARIISELLIPCQPLLDKITSLAARPSARFPVPNEDTVYAPLDHLLHVLYLAQLFQAQSLARITEGGSPDSETSTILRLAAALQHEPLAISHIGSSTITDGALDVINHGIKRHVWAEAQLAQFETLLAPVDFPGRAAPILRAERGFMNHAVTFLQANPAAARDFRDFVTRTYYTDIHPLLLATLPLTYASAQAGQNRTIQTWAAQLDSSPGYPTLKTSFDASQKALTSSSPLASIRYFSAVMPLQTLKSPFLEKTFSTQTQINQTRIAIALERYRLAHSTYPETLSGLVPTYLPTIPKDALADAPMHYQRKSPSEFLLYSVGPNLKDEGGQPAPRPSQGDLVWGYEPQRR